MKKARDDLIATVRSGIEQRGFYLLMDSRLDLICGPGCWKATDAEAVAKVHAFARSNGWQVQRSPKAFMFRKIE